MTLDIGTTNCNINSWLGRAN